MVAMKTFTVTAQRWEDGWELYVGDVGATQSTTLATARQEAQDYLATMLGGEPEDYPVSLLYRLGGLEADAEASRQATAEAAKAQEDAAAQARRVARELRASGLSVTDVAEIMHISRGRVSQLTSHS